MKKYPVYIAYLYHKDASPSDAKDYPFNVDDHEDMSESEIRSYISAKWPNLRIDDIR